MNEVSEKILEFVGYAESLKGDEKGEAQVFCDRLFQAFGHKGYKEAGATLEHRVKGKNQNMKYVDLVWRPRLLIEMKSRGEKLQRHYRQAFDYWLQLVPNRPRYVILCNFDEFWIYDFDAQLEEPMDKISLIDLPQRYTALNFLFPDEKKPLFNNNRVAVTRAAADKVAKVFNTLIERGEKREIAQRFILQSVVAMFSEDSGLLPKGLFTSLLKDCETGQSTYDVIGGLFKQMNDPNSARGGRYQGVQYFDGGLFKTVDPVDLTKEEIGLLLEAVNEDWSKVQPVIFGSLFEGSMDKKERHAYGAHYTSEADIQKVVLPTIVRPWQEKIEEAKTWEDLTLLHEELLKFRVLDPACGSGNFLYVAYRELKHIEAELLIKMYTEFSRKAKAIDIGSKLSTKQFFGIDNNHFAVELAKVTLMLAKELAIEESRNLVGAAQEQMWFHEESTLPLDNLDENILCEDALFTEWPKADAIIGNPPYQSKNKMQKVYGPAYLNKLRAKYPDVPGRADYCVYWFRKAHDQLTLGGRAGLVGTNTIRQNYSREGSLDYIVEHGGTITEAVSTQVWSGDAVVHVSIVNWLKGKQTGLKRLYIQKGDNLSSPWESVEMDEINSSLSFTLDVSGAVILQTNRSSEMCYQGQTHGHEGFLLQPADAQKMIAQSPKNSEVLFPYLTGDELFSYSPPYPQRYVIDFHPRDIVTAQSYQEPFERIRMTVLPTREVAAQEEIKRNQEALEINAKAKVNRHHQNFLKRWWLLSYAREELIKKIANISRYIVCSQVTKRPIFEFVSSKIRPNAALIVFAKSDDYSFGILQSDIHWQWFKFKCSTLKGDFRYTSNSVFDTFPWPQNPSNDSIKEIAENSIKLRELRNKMMKETGSTLRDLYRLLDLPGQNPLREAQQVLDSAVREAYGMKSDEDVLTFLLKLNKALAAKEKNGEKIVGSGLPPSIKNPQEFVTEDCVHIF